MPKRFHVSIENGEARFVFKGQPIESSDGVWKLRQLKQWTQKELAAHLGKKTPSIIKKWEGGSAPVPQTDLRLMGYLIADTTSHPNLNRVSELE